MRSVVLSTTEAEHIALPEVAQELKIIIRTPTNNKFKLRFQ